MKSIRYILSLFLIILYPSVTFADTTWYPDGPAAYNACVSENSSCVLGYYGQYGSCTIQADRYSGIQTGDIYAYCFNGDTTCEGGTVLDFSGACSCPSGQVEDGSGGCFERPADCDAGQIDYVCGSAICTGTFVAPTQCWLESPPAGCEAGVKFHPGCDLVCPGQSTPNAEGTGCDDPTCGSEQYLENHSCHDYPPCIGEQTRNPETHACDDPTCGDGWTKPLSRRRTPASDCL